MAQSIEEILGKVERDRAVPGTRPGESEKVRYVSFERSQSPADVFEGVVWKLNPSLTKKGGVVLENFIITLPDGTPFYALKYHGDLIAWQKQIEQGATDLGFLTGKLESET